MTSYILIHEERFNYRQYMTIAATFEAENERQAKRFAEIWNEQNRKIKGNLVPEYYYFITPEKYKQNEHEYKTLVPIEHYDVEAVKAYIGKDWRQS